MGAVEVRENDRFFEHVEIYLSTVEACPRDSYGTSPCIRHGAQCRLSSCRVLGADSNLRRVGAATRSSPLKIDAKSWSFLTRSFSLRSYSLRFRSRNHYLLRIRISVPSQHAQGVRYMRSKGTSHSVNVVLQNRAERVFV